MSNIYSVTKEKDGVLTAAEAKELYNNSIENRLAKTVAWIGQELLVLHSAIKEAACRGELSVTKSYQRAVSDLFESPPVQMTKLVAALEEKGYLVKWSETGQQTNRNNTESRIYKVLISWDK